MDFNIIMQTVCILGLRYLSTLELAHLFYSVITDNFSSVSASVVFSVLFVCGMIPLKFV